MVEKIVGHDVEQEKTNDYHSRDLTGSHSLVERAIINAPSDNLEAK